MIRRLLLWTALGLLGVAAAAGVTLAADRLTSQRIGLADAPVSAGDDLAPAALTPAATGPRRVRRPPAVAPTTTTTTWRPPATAPTAPPPGAGASPGTAPNGSGADDRSHGGSGVSGRDRDGDRDD